MLKADIEQLGEWLKETHTLAFRATVHNWAAKKPENLKVLLYWIQHGTDEVSNRAAWAFDGTDEITSGMGARYLAEVTDALEVAHYPGVYRSLLRFMARHTVPEEYLGRLLEVCFKLLNDTGMPVAVKCNAIYVIIRYIEVYPELCSELEASITYQLSGQSVAFQAASRKALKKIAQVSAPKKKSKPEIVRK